MYQALYRKWRPQVFADVVGQDHITTTLMNEIKNGRHSHAYLFTGSRGTGKTTCAKIFAKAVNCEHPVNGDPCNECKTCKGIDSGSVMDVIEIDAASNNGVDNIRDIRDEANFTPVGGKYRVYIIDEVHMLSIGAFNALLKTLEEPPEHVKFVLATTEVHKLPATILSRCQRFDFKRITPEDISARLSYVANQEGLTLEPDAAILIARLADGALRDALSILDQCIGHSKHITVDIVNETVGLAGKDYLFSISSLLVKRDGAGTLEKINELHNRSCDMERLCNELINHYRNIMICKAVKNPKDLIVCSETELDEYKQTADAYSMDYILEILNILGETLSNLKRSLSRRVEMEMAIIKLCSSSMVSVTPATVSAPIDVAQADTVQQPTPVNEAPISAPADATPADAVQPPVEEATPSAPVIEAPISAPTDVAPATQERVVTTLEDGPVPTAVWNAIVRETVMMDKPLIGTLNSAVTYKRDTSLLINTDNVLLRKLLTMEEHKNYIREAVFTVVGEFLEPVITDVLPESEQVSADENVREEENVHEVESDPLDNFIDSIQNDAQIDFSFYIEE